MTRIETATGREMFHIYDASTGRKIGGSWSEDEAINKASNLAQKTGKTYSLFRVQRVLSVSGQPRQP